MSFIPVRDTRHWIVGARLSGQHSGLIFKCGKMDVSTHESDAVSNVEHLTSSDTAPYTGMTVTSTELLRTRRNQHTHVFLTIPRVKRYCLRKRP